MYKNGRQIYNRTCALTFALIDFLDKNRIKKHLLTSRGLKLLKIINYHYSLYNIIVSIYNGKKKIKKYIFK